ncbi:MAG: hypothetical protein E7408_01370 [Ruminococcaceae bacterium]|nr:hypothetical protein [Oscillospiraceae bacterium]
MQIYVPSYYRDFACTAGKCQHSCCIGWEIDVDDTAYQRYREVGGEIGRRLQENIAVDGDGAHFIRGADRRCPFLNKENLCDIILEMGEEALCHICTDHPRYRNFFTGRIEMGLGLCCEAAADLILSRAEKPTFLLFSGDGEEELTPEEEQVLALRDRLLDMAYDITVPVEKRFEEIARRCTVTLPEKSAKAWRDFYGGLLILHDDWLKMLEGARDAITLSETYAPRLFAYFLCRHFPGGLVDGQYRARLAFALHATRFILSLTGVPVREAARAYSEEIEYAEENMEALLSCLEN